MVTAPGSLGFYMVDAVRVLAALELTGWFRSVLPVDDLVGDSLPPFVERGAVVAVGGGCVRMQALPGSGGDEVEQHLVNVGGVGPEQAVRGAVDLDVVGLGERGVEGPAGCIDR